MRSLEIAEMRISLSSLREGISEFEFHISGSAFEFREGIAFPDGIEVKVNITPVGGDYLIDLRVRAEGGFVCDRCSEFFRQIIENKVQTIFTFDEEKIDEENDDIKLLLPSVHEIDISQEVRDALILSVPVKLLCRESCKGLCVQCGTNLNRGSCQCIPDNSDPRWDVLKNLRSRIKNK